MKFDVWLIDPQPLTEMPKIANKVEENGFDGLWTVETGNDGFFPLILAAEHSQRINMGTSIAVAFARNPTTLAAMAWDLARYSDGRFIMGLGTQVKAHIERRYGIPWEKPLRKLRETVEVMHAVWDSWQNGTKLRYEGEFFNLSLMIPNFSPEPLDGPRPPVYVSAVNKGMLKLAGKVCDGVILHPFHSTTYLKEFALPMLDEGLAVNGRTRADITTCCSVFAMPTDGEKAAAHYEQYARQQIAFYMSTPAYRVVLEHSGSDHHGWVGTSEQLSQLARQGEWDQMQELITDEMLDAFAISGKWGELPAKAQARFGDMIDRTNFYLPFSPTEEQDGWRAAVAGFRR